jgi:hypothetical protein
VSALDSEILAQVLKWAATERAASLEGMASGTLDHDKYKYACGYVKALDDMVRVSDVIRDQLQKG